MTRSPLFVTAAAGTEKPLKQELRELRLAGLKGERGGVRLEGDLRAIAKICLASRVAMRVLIQIGKFRCASEDDLYRGVHEIAWERWLTSDRTLAVNAVTKDSALTHSKYVGQKTKDAIVDRQRTREGVRSSVDRNDADVDIFVRVHKDEAEVFLDASGRSLHRRGWRIEAGEAPLKETLAAAIIRLSGWDRTCPLVDPLAGSGTFAIEADLLARGVPAQRAEERFGFERWADHGRAEAAIVRAVRDEQAGRQVAEGPSSRGIDHDETMVEIARRNAERAQSRASFEVGRLRDLRLTEPSHIVANPPYGERLESERQFWDELRGAFGRHRGHRVTLLLPEHAPEDLLPRRRARGHRLFNGRLPCRLVTWDAAG